VIELLKTMLPAAMGDALTVQGIPAAGVAAASFAYALNALVPKRMKSASDIWVQIVGRDWGALSEEQEEELASIVDTFLQIARKGTAKANLRLLARIISGQKAAKALKADEFMYYAEIIASLRHEEIVLLGTMKHQTEITEKRGGITVSEKTPKILIDIMLNTKGELVPQVFKTDIDFWATARALARTGFIYEETAGIRGSVWSLTSVFNKVYVLVPMYDLLSAKNE